MKKPTTEVIVIQLEAVELPHVQCGPAHMFSMYFATQLLIEPIYTLVHLSFKCTLSFVFSTLRMLHSLCFYGHWIAVIWSLTATSTNSQLLL